MAEEVKKRSKDKWKKKKWFEVFSPDLLDKKKIADTIAEKPEQLIGRNILVSVRDLSSQAKKVHILLRFKINNVQGLKAYTALVGHEVIGSYLKRFVRRNASKIQLVQTVSTKDTKKANVTSVVICQRKISKDKETAIRKIVEEEIDSKAKKLNFDELVQDFVFGGIPGNIFNAAKKVALIKRVEIIKSRPLSE